MQKPLVALIIIAVGILTAYVWWTNGTSAPNAKDKAQKIFIVRKGESVREIANNLKKEGFIKDTVIFFLIVKKLGLDGKIQAGDFRLSPSMNTNQIAETLTHGTLDIWVTIQEGKRAEEIADILKKSIPSYKDSWRAALVPNEGYLFPDTYLIPRDATINLIISIMKNNFDKKYTNIDVSKKPNLTQNEVVIIASMVEREAKFAEDRPLVASVILNRLNIGMKLDIDATVQYVLGYQADQKSWWKKGLTHDDLLVRSNYNTYRHAGLPPTPISNPGLAALDAVVNAPNTDYLYYISDKSGKNHYAKTINDHNANIKKYGL